jgi:hypothetical protein
MAELADVLDLGSSGVIRAGSNPVTRTKTVACHSYKGKLFFYAKSLETVRFQGFLPSIRFLSGLFPSADAALCTPIIILCTPLLGKNEE